MGAFFDKAEATERCLEGVITRVDKNYTDTSRSGGGRNLEHYAHITVENGTKIVKQVKSNRIGQKIKLREYKTKIRNITVYKIASCS
ncbi:MAG: hypothetical protein ACI9SP_002793 [Arenicella sp.]|jgi:hypothetical protein